VTSQTADRLTKASAWKASGYQVDEARSYVDIQDFLLLKGRNSSERLISALSAN
jgi:hypothetical protein